MHYRVSNSCADSHKLTLFTCVFLIILWFWYLDCFGFVLFWILLSFIAYTPPTCFLAFHCATYTHTQHSRWTPPGPVPALPLPLLTVAAATSWQSCSPVDSTSGITQPASPHCGWLCAPPPRLTVMGRTALRFLRAVLPCFGLLRFVVLHCRRCCAAQAGCKRLFCYAVNLN